MTKDWILWAAACVLVLAALQDLFRLRISNIFPAALLALFIAWVAANGWESSLWMNGLNFLFAFAVGTFLFARGWMGGGDVKLFAASALWFDWAGILTFLGGITISGGILALALIVIRRLLPTPISSSRPPFLKRGGPIPYGVAIAAGTLICLYMTGPNPSGIVSRPSFIH